MWWGRVERGEERAAVKRGRRGGGGKVAARGGAARSSGFRVRSSEVKARDEGVLGHHRWAGRGSEAAERLKKIGERGLGLTSLETVVEF